jgi:hypothetical protein
LLTALVGLLLEYESKRMYISPDVAGTTQEFGFLLLEAITDIDHWEPENVKPHLDHCVEH